MIKPIAIFLPQYHPIPENNEWWGEGFTEWTNVTKAKPYFKGHYQPHLPTDLGFYDLRLPESRLAQEKLAQEHGIYGFCYYHYWFDGKQVLEYPIEQKLKHKEQRLPFMLCWANENWTRKWDGGNNEVLLEQNYSKEDAQNFARHLIPYFKDERYIRNNGKVLFAIYRSEIIPNIDDYIEEIHKEANRNEIKVEIARFESFGNYGNKFMKGFDSAIEFQPFSESLIEYKKLIIQKRYKRKLILRSINKICRFLNYNKTTERLLWHHFNKLDYSEFVKFNLEFQRIPNDYLRYPGITPSWDNSARRKQLKNFLFVNETPELFEIWLMEIYKKLMRVPKKMDQSFIFINAWNEWAEGNHLEPCIKHGNKYLNSVKRVVRKFHERA